MANDTIEYRPWSDWGGIDIDNPSVMNLKPFGYSNKSIPPSYGALPLERCVKVLMSSGMMRYTAKDQFALWCSIYGKSKLRLASWSADEFDDTSIATASELAEVLEEINNLAFQDESDDFGLLRPTYHALATCMRTMLAFVRDGEPLRPSDISTDRNGDIRIAWTTEDKEAEIVFPSSAEEAPYIYYSSPDSYGTIADIRPHVISKWVHWAIRNR